MKTDQAKNFLINGVIRILRDDERNLNPLNLTDVVNHLIVSATKLVSGKYRFQNFWNEQRIGLDKQELVPDLAEASFHKENITTSKVQLVILPQKNPNQIGSIFTGRQCTYCSRWVWKQHSNEINFEIKTVARGRDLLSKWIGIGFSYGIKMVLRCLHKPIQGQKSISNFQSDGIDMIIGYIDDQFSYVKDMYSEG